MTLLVELVEQFEAARPRLMSLAHRILGSNHDAEDAVQVVWLRAQATDLADVANRDGWFTTVTARLCLDQLRQRQRRRELPLLADDIPDQQVRADEAFLQREDVSRALLVLLGELSPQQRVAYVLHDLFSVPFAQIAVALDTTTTAAKKLASRARTRLRDAQPDGSGRGDHWEIVEAFLTAARGGDIAQLVTLLAPDAVRTAHPRLLPTESPTTVHGADAVAEETKAFIHQIAAAVPVLISGEPGAIIAPGGHPYALINFTINARLITRIDISPYPRGKTSLIS